MFDLGATELLVIGIVLIIVVGPKELPKMLRTFGQFVTKMRGMAREFQSMFEEAARDTGLEDVTKGVSDVRNFSVTDQVSKAFDPLTEEAEALKQEMVVTEPPELSEKVEDPVEVGNMAARKATAKPATKARTARKPSTAKKKTASRARKPKKAETGA